MQNAKSFIMGAVVMALIASVAFNFYQAGQLRNAIIGAQIPPMPESKLKGEK